MCPRHQGGRDNKWNLPSNIKYDDCTKGCVTFPNTLCPIVSPSYSAHLKLMTTPLNGWTDGWVMTNLNPTFGAKTTCHCHNNFRPIMLLDDASLDHTNKLGRETCSAASIWELTVCWTKTQCSGSNPPEPCAETAMQGKPVRWAEEKKKGEC